jgi:hypothetical protein
MAMTRTNKTARRALVARLDSMEARISPSFTISPPVNHGPSIVTLINTSNETPILKVTTTLPSQQNSAFKVTTPTVTGGPSTVTLINSSNATPILRGVTVSYNH